ncbi:hypothetical protein VA596_44275 [Amycolatopsis sp., V23-08]|uniref:AbiTii domain-containing protein n=1 Tax=Amycolatopsis heterodermiae TaxID=3110235 RepID=A0ABU5RK07_9PSEU|nr:hypothetical protein [Amycolatopsis sp., V23-08]MEA5366612.1 hypothetical protein [Amycolatopsis sp., V23-08]
MAEQDQNVRDALRLFTLKLSREARAASTSLTPWTAKEQISRQRTSPASFDAATEYEAIMAKQRARFRPPPPPDPATAPEAVAPELQLRLADAGSWLAKACALADRWSGLENFDGWVSFNVDSDCGYLLGQALQPGATYSRKYLMAKVKDISEGLNSISVSLHEFQVPGSLIKVPEVVHAPRFARLNPGILARLLSEDLAARIEAGRELEKTAETAGVMSPPIQKWVEEASDVLGGLSPEVLHGFTRLVSGSAACGCLGVTSPIELARAYLALGLDYLEEVRERMPDYAEASGQLAPEPRVSMTFEGGTFNGAQFAGTISNVDSTIAGVVNQSGSDTAAALKALEQAVLSESRWSKDEKRDLLDNVECLAEAAEKPPEKRNRGMLKSVLSALTAAAAGGTAVGKVMDSWGDVLHKILP